MELPKTQPKFVCDCCLFVTSHKNDYNKHLLTAKHKTREKNPDLELIYHHSQDCVSITKYVIILIVVITTPQ
jgi:hypothetical protein